MPKKKGPETVRVSLYMPVELHASLVDLAKNDKRSLNQQIISMSESWVTVVKHLKMAEQKEIKNESKTSEVSNILL